ncbi:MFS general substrate transporter [Ceraceosorus guamensis]|uniref:MFS general substrate transporter n=1 Tax=Ceraceosorus guamensis TaxID=1522189 RepID=A0A316W365_9BASI|nr:MFS general substrate transporter [Ceraceosorus guamensis]PWN44337.1 MFS general substrate transporter [Ceraceosorus guamensis]
MSYPSSSRRGPAGPQHLSVRDPRAQPRSFTPSDDPYGFDSPIPPEDGAHTPIRHDGSHAPNGYATPNSGVSEDFNVDDPAPTPYTPYNLNNTRARNSNATLVSTASQDFFGMETAMQEHPDRRPNSRNAGRDSRLGRFGGVFSPTAAMWEAGANRDRYNRLSRQLNSAISHAPAIPNVRLNTLDKVSEEKRIADPETEQKKKPLRTKKTKRFWLIFAALMGVTCLTAIDMSIISTSLPTIVAQLPQSRIPATWITSAFLLTTTAFQPFMGGLADVVGRRNSLVTAVVLFLVGSLICALAKDMLTLVAGRGVQGVGGGGVQAIAEIVLSDLTTLRERGLYVGLISLVFAVSTFIAPVLGGVFSETDWRWIFWMNLPLGGVVLAMIIPTMKLHTPPMPWKEKLHRMDIPANLVLFGSVIALLIAITEGGVEHPWGSARIIGPLVAGSVGIAIWLALEFIPNRFAPDPVLPLRLFTNITAGTCFFMTFIHGIVTYGATYILPVYFQSIKGANPLRSAIDIFPSTAPGPIAAIIAGIVMAVTGKYKIQIAFWWATILLGVGLILHWDVDTPVYEWVIIQLVPGFGVGALYALTLPPIQSSLPVVELAHATATFAFCRSLGSVFGIAFTTTIFVAQVDPKLAAIPGAAEAGLRGSTALGFATELHRLPAELQPPVIDAFMSALRSAFLLLVPCAAIGLIASFFVKELPLPDFNESDYGINDGTNPNAVLANAEVAHQAEEGLVTVEKMPKAPERSLTKGSQPPPSDSPYSPYSSSGKFGRSPSFDHGSSSSPDTSSPTGYPKSTERRMSTSEAYKKAQAALAHAQPPKPRHVRRRSSRLSLYGDDENEKEAHHALASLRDVDRARKEAARQSVRNPDGTWLGTVQNDPAGTGAAGFGDFDYGVDDDDDYDWRQGRR